MIVWLHLILTLQAIGGCIFGIGVEVRPILRLVEHSYKSHVRIFCELMLVNGIVQIISAGFSCFTACWKLVWTMYIAVVLSICVILLQIAAIVGVFYLMSESTDMVTEFIHKAWFEWECQAFGSCHNAFINYIYYYMMPQVIISAIAIFFEVSLLNQYALIIVCKPDTVFNWV